MLGYDLLQLLAEHKALTRMIESTRIEDVLDRGSLTVRLEKVEHQISQAAGQAWTRPNP